MQLDAVLQRLAAGDFELTLHAQQRMSERNITYSDVLECGRSGKAIAQSDRKIKIVGRDEYNERITLICALEDKVIIITVY